MHHEMFFCMFNIFSYKNKCNFNVQIYTHIHYVKLQVTCLIYLINTIWLICFFMIVILIACSEVKQILFQQIFIHKYTKKSVTQMS